MLLGSKAATQLHVIPMPTQKTPKAGNGHLIAAKTIKTISNVHSPGKQVYGPSEHKYAARIQGTDYHTSDSVFARTGGVEDCSGDRNANDAGDGADGISHAEKERRVPRRQVSVVAV